MSRPARPPGRPVDLAKQQSIVAAAWALFLAYGIEAVPIESVAKQAGVSKVTLYRYFPDKQALLEAGVRAEMHRIETAQQLSPQAGQNDIDIAGRLRQFGLGVMHFLATPNAVAFYAKLAGELSRHPDLAKRFWAAGPGRTRANLVALLSTATHAGELDLDDPELAAEQLFGLWQGFTNLQYPLGVRDDIGLVRRVEAGVQLFLRAHPTPAAQTTK